MSFVEAFMTPTYNTYEYEKGNLKSIMHSIIFKGISHTLKITHWLYDKFMQMILSVVVNNIG